MSVTKKISKKIKPKQTTKAKPRTRQTEKRIPTSAKKVAKTRLEQKVSSKDRSSQKASLNVRVRTESPTKEALLEITEDKRFFFSPESVAMKRLAQPGEKSSRKAPKKQSELPRLSVNPAEATELRRSKHLILVSGVAFFMILISFAWIISLTSSIQDNNFLSSNNSQSGQSQISPVGTKDRINDLKKELGSLKDKLSELNAGMATVNEPIATTSEQTKATLEKLKQRLEYQASSTTELSQD